MEPLIRAEARPFRLEDEGLDQIVDNQRKPKRDRLTRIRIFEELRDLGYDGCYDAVRRYTAAWSKSETEATAAAFVPLSFGGGEALITA